MDVYKTERDHLQRLQRHHLAIFGTIMQAIANREEGTDSKEVRTAAKNRADEHAQFATLIGTVLTRFYQRDEADSGTQQPYTGLERRVERPTGQQF